MMFYLLLLKLTQVASAETITCQVRLEDSSYETLQTYDLKIESDDLVNEVSRTHDIYYNVPNKVRFENIVVKDGECVPIDITTDDLSASKTAEDLESIEQFMLQNKKSFRNRVGLIGGGQLIGAGTLWYYAYIFKFYELETEDREYALYYSQKSLQNQLFSYSLLATGIAYSSWQLIKNSKTKKNLKALQSSKNEELATSIQNESVIP
jgi:hypothetical protein